MDDNIGPYVSYGQVLLELSDSASPKVTTEDTTLANFVTDPGGDLFEYTGGIPVVGKIVEQDGKVENIIALLTTPNRIRVETVGTLIVDGAANILSSTSVTKRKSDVYVALAMAMIDKGAGRFFNKRTGTFTIKGNNSHILFFDVPIIEITAFSVNDGAVDLVLDTNYRIFAGRAEPADDRDNPKIELITETGSIFTNIHTSRAFFKDLNQVITGSFGYLEADGSTPLLIQQATLMQTLYAIQNNLLKESKSKSKGTLRRLKVDLHEQEFFEQRSQTRGFPLTPLNEVNNIIAMYKTSIRVGGSFKEATYRITDV